MPIDTEPLEAQKLRNNPLDVSLSALDPSIDDSLGYNITSGTLGWVNNPYAITVLIDTRSNISFISRKVVARLPRDRKLKEASPLRVRLTNGDTTLSTTTLTTRITLGTFKARTILRILD